MPKKGISTKKISVKIKNIKEKKEAIDEKIVAEKGKELFNRVKKNAVQKRIFGLEEREQELLKTAYMVFTQTCPELSREN